MRTTGIMLVTIDIIEDGIVVTSCTDTMNLLPALMVIQTNLRDAFWPTAEIIVNAFWRA